MNIPDREPDVWTGVDMRKGVVSVLGFLWAMAWALFVLLVPIWLIALMWRAIVQ